jgi:hypothetical protein
VLDLLILLVPQEAWLPLMVIGGLLIIIGFRRAGLGIIGTICMLALFVPFFDALVYALPEELFWPLMIVCSFMVIRAIFGRRVMDNLLSYLLWEIIRAPFRFLGWFFRGMGRRPH